MIELSPGASYGVGVVLIVTALAAVAKAHSPRSTAIVLSGRPVADRGEVAYGCIIGIDNLQLLKGRQVIICVAITVVKAITMLSGRIISAHIRQPGQTGCIGLTGDGICIAS